MIAMIKNETETSQVKLKSLLKELFQFDVQDLDFGIYRIMNMKRNEIENFIEKELIETTEAEFKEYAKVSEGDIRKEIEKLVVEINRDFGEGTIDGQGRVKKNEDAPKVKEYIKKNEDLKNAQITQGQVKDVFNHVYEFFSRYYDKGDFLSKRRYGGKNKYSIPYNGEEVVLYWANQDQYYVKTDEYFKKYNFKVGGNKVNFMLKEAETEKNNIKESTKHFILCEGDFLSFDEGKKELDIYFNYRELTEEERKKYGTRNTQESIVLEAVNKILSKLGEKGPVEELSKKVDDERTVLEKHIATYVKRNTTDYFIHKNLKSFLERELDFYIKNEVLDLDEIEQMDERNTRLNKAKIRAIRVISGKIVDFLAQIEDFQRMLWEKKKFVLRADYCMTLDLVPEKFYNEIGRNERQVAEWKELFKLDETTKGALDSIKGKKTLDLDFLKSHKYLVLDTKFFDQEFKDRLLTTFDNLDEKIGGLMVKSENWQALNLLQKRYSEQVKCTYIDPPYNTGNDGFLYKDNYQHSSWLSMIENRAEKALSLLTLNGTFYSSIDDHEVSNLVVTLNNLFGENNLVSILAIVNNFSGRSDRKNIATAHEHMVMYKNRDFEAFGLSIPDDYRKEYSLSDDGGSYRLQGLRKRGFNAKREDRPNLYYPIYYNPETKDIIVEKRNGYCEILPKLSDGSDGNWRWSKETVMEKKNLLLVKKVSTRDEYDVFQKDYLFVNGAEKKIKAKSIWLESDYSSDFATTAYKKLMPDVPFSNPKSPILIRDICSISTEGDDIVLDYYAGSGTTAQAVLDLNLNDNGNRKYILVEMADYFDTVMKPRIQKVMYSSEWKDGVPQNTDGISHMFKYMYLEQYEDTLNNIAFKEKDKTVQETLDGFSDYFLRYMLDYETRESPCRLAVDKFKDPFNYKLKITNAGEERNKTIDLVETFNYLLGVHVEKVRTLLDGNRKYRVVFGKKEDRKIAIIWRSLEGINYKKDAEFIEKSILQGEAFSRIFVNGDSSVSSAEPVEPEFKKLMGA